MIAYTTSLLKARISVDNVIGIDPQSLDTIDVPRLTDNIIAI